MSPNITIPETTEEVLNMALEMEDEGYRTYIDGAKTIKNSLGKRMLERLASDELDHIKRIKEVYQAIEGKRDWDKVKVNADQDSVTFQSIFDRIKSEIRQSAEELGSHGVDDEEIIETAINLENHAKFFYAETAKKVNDKKVKQFLEILTGEEEAHYKALRNINNFMADPANWFATQGKF
ncbi:MAG: ferritin family protein [Calditrichota bacterium]